jgi:hypothetical protein
MTSSAILALFSAASLALFNCGDFRVFFSVAITGDLLQHTLAAGDALHVAGRSYSHGDGTCKSLEDGFQAMMIVIAIEEFHVQVHASIFAEALEEVFEHASFNSACGSSRELHIPDKADAVAKVNAHAAQGFVHRNKVKSIAFNALFVTEAFYKRLAEHNSDVFHAVVHIDLGIALAVQIEVESAMHLEQIQHVIQEARTRVYLTSGAIVQIQEKLNIGFTRLTRNLRRTHLSTSYLRTRPS